MAEIHYENRLEKIEMKPYAAGEMRSREREFCAKYTSVCSAGEGVEVMS